MGSTPFRSLCRISTAAQELAGHAHYHSGLKIEDAKSFATRLLDPIASRFDLPPACHYDSIS